MPDFIVSALLVPVTKVLVPIVTLYLGKAILNAKSKLDALPVYAKQGVIVVIAGLLTSAQQFFGVDVCGGQPCSFDSLSVDALANAAVAFILHAALKARKAK